MASIPPPQGMTESDYETIEAAVTETVRGRWFLAEFARRNRVAETRQLLDAMSRLEAAVASNQVALPSADPSIRLLVQRIKEIATSLGALGREMRAADVEEHFIEAVDSQARAIAGMMRSATPGIGNRPAEVKELDAKPRTAEAPAPQIAPPERAPSPAPPPAPRMPRADLPPAFVAPRPGATEDPRHAALAEIDALPLAQKLAMFR